MKKTLLALPLSLGLLASIALCANPSKANATYGPSIAAPYNVISAVTTDSYGNLGEKIEYELNEQMQRLSEIRFNYIDDAWVPYDKSEYSYDESGYVSTEKEYNYSSADTAFVEHKITAYTYDGDGNTLQELCQVKNGEDWRNSHKYIYTYDEDGNQTSRELYNHNSTLGDWAKGHRIDYSYDENGNKTASEAKYYWVDQQGAVHFSGAYIYTWTYDAQNRVTQEIQKYTTNEDLTDGELRDKYDYSYEDGKTIRESYEYEEEEWLLYFKTETVGVEDTDGFKTLSWMWEHGAWEFDYGASLAYHYDDNQNIDGFDSFEWSDETTYELAYNCKWTYYTAPVQPVEDGEFPILAVIIPCGVIVLLVGIYFISYAVYTKNDKGISFLIPTYKGLDKVFGRKQEKKGAKAKKATPKAKPVEAAPKAEQIEEALKQ